MKTHQRNWESRNGLSRLCYLLFLFCLCVCMYVGLNVYNSLLSVVLELRTRLFLSCEHLLALLRYEKGSPFKSLPLQPHGLPLLWRRIVLVQFMLKELQPVSNYREFSSLKRCSAEPQFWKVPSRISVLERKRQFHLFRVRGFFPFFSAMMYNNFNGRRRRKE